MQFKPSRSQHHFTPRHRNAATPSFNAIETATRRRTPHGPAAEGCQPHPSMQIEPPGGVRHTAPLPNARDPCIVPPPRRRTPATMHRHTAPSPNARDPLRRNDLVERARGFPVHPAIAPIKMARRLSQRLRPPETMRLPVLPGGLGCLWDVGMYRPRRVK